MGPALAGDPARLQGGPTQAVCWVLVLMLGKQCLLEFRACWQSYGAPFRGDGHFWSRQREDARGTGGLPSPPLYPHPAQ